MDGIIFTWVDSTWSPVVLASGDPILIPNRTFHDIFQNINRKFNKQLQKNNIFNIITSFNADSFGFSEPNIHWTHTQQSQYRHILTHHWPHHCLVFTKFKSSLTDDLTSDWLPGGTVQTLHGRHAGRVSSFYADQFGRWVSQTLKLKNEKKLTIITA